MKAGYDLAPARKVCANCDAPGIRWFRLRVEFDADGTPSFRGIVQIWDGSSNTVLVAETDGGSASCADQNGNGQPGITELAFLTRHARTGERVPVSLTAEADDIDQNGEHTVAFRAGDFSTRLAILVRAVPKRRRPRPRRRRR